MYNTILQSWSKLLSIGCKQQVPVHLHFYCYNTPETFKLILQLLSRITWKLYYRGLVLGKFIWGAGKFQHHIWFYTNANTEHWTLYLFIVRCHTRVASKIEISESGDTKCSVCTQNDKNISYSMNNNTWFLKFIWSSYGCPLTTLMHFPGRLTS